MSSHFFQKFYYLKKIIDKRVEEYGAQYTIFGIFGVINYPVFYFFWKCFSPQSYGSFLLRATATLLSVVLLFHQYWPKKWLTFLPVYWYVTLLFCMPFFFTFMFFQNHGATAWAFTLIPVSAFLMLLVDWASGVVLLVIGTLLGALLSYMYQGRLFLVTQFDYLSFFLNYLFSAVIGFVFAENRQRLEREKVQTIKSIGSSIAHELRTPLLTMRAGATGIKNILMNRGEQEQSLLKVLSSIEDEAYASNTIINMLLMKINGDAKFASKSQCCSMLSVVKLALERYPFVSESQKSGVNYDKESDFIFCGNELLMTHVFFNLLKNALYYIDVAGKGSVEIRIKKNNKKNYLYFRDTGKGVPKKILPHVFDKFFSQTRNGSGLGLWFCKMVMKSYGGDMACFSVEGEFTEFVLKFPVVKKINENVVNEAESVC
ncbi:MAG: HAMP domain-containing histidine kinase [Gammaproteobacteria bacterium]|nr:HAMP domain-containing histidine kinase [Gammaproteobacteria bacterium]